MIHGIQVEGLVKRFGETQALAGVSFTAEPGTILGLLGPNGAGKTTATRVLATLSDPTEGSARVGGYDVVREAHQARQLIGLTGQYAGVDELLTGTENLVMIGRLLGMPQRASKVRAGELVARFGLIEAAERPAKTYSGGMRRRLDLAACLVGRPQFLFLDEPTTGLDPRSRTCLWDIVRGLTADGVTVLLTTQYLEEADQLTDDLIVIDHGQIIARGTPDELKAQVGGQVLELRPRYQADTITVTKVASELTGATPEVRGGLVAVGIADPAIMSAMVRRLDEVGVMLTELSMRTSSLDEVFFALTGDHTEDVETEASGLAKSTDKQSQLERVGVARRRLNRWASSREEIPRRSAEGSDPEASSGQSLSATGITVPTVPRLSQRVSPGAAARNIATLVWRNLVQIKHHPLEVLDLSIQPMIFVLLFAYVFGPVMAGSVAAYLPLLIPGIIVQNALFAGMTTGIGLSIDITKGIFDRFRSLPIARSAPLTGRIIADTAKQAWSMLILLSMGFAIGFRIKTSLTALLMAFVLLLTFAVLFSWTSVYIAMKINEPEKMQIFGFVVILPLSFLSTAFIPTMQGIPRPVAWIMENSPVTHLVEAMRGLLVGGQVLGHALITLAWALGIFLVFAPLSLRAFKKKCA